MNSQAILVLILLVVNIPVYRLLFRVFFTDDDDFKESVKYSLTPDLISLFRGRYWKDKFGQTKITFFAVLCVVVVLLEVFLVQQMISFLS
ncbi:hypothetical protein [Paenibacillus sp. N3.4]|uniref:hypothetical protein n=1 Tax=Paenibacillus sp. N3.4 TaxID=2603222 RepID=UPI001C9CB2D6|nr:hypothetical protein [Paenibacillus sp. N3.4]